MANTHSQLQAAHEAELNSTSANYAAEILALSASHATDLGNLKIEVKELKQNLAKAGMAAEGKSEELIKMEQRLKELESELKGTKKVLAESKKDEGTEKKLEVVMKELDSVREELEGTKEVSPIQLSSLRIQGRMS